MIINRPRSIEGLLLQNVRVLLVGLFGSAIIIAQHFHILFCIL